MVAWFRHFKDSGIVKRTALPVSRLLAAVTEPRPRPEDKHAMPLWSPAVYAPEATKRSNAGVVAMSCLVLDYDDGARPEDSLGPWRDVSHAWTPSYSWTDDAPRWRLIVPLAADVPAEDWRAVWGWAAGRSPGADAACKDPSRAFFLPCRTAQGTYPHGVHIGPLLDVGAVVRAARDARQRPRLPRTDALPDHRGDMALMERDPAYRERVGMAAGGQRTDNRIKGARCPSCGRNSAWFLIQPEQWTGAACDHRKSCGWAGGVRALETA